MVASLERTDGNAEFHQIVDFLATSPIHYALTIIDGKTVIALAEPFNDVYVTHVHTKKVFTNMKRQNKDFSRKVTPLFASMLVPHIVEGKGSGQPSEPQPPSSTAPPSLKEQVTTVASQPQKTHRPRQAKREDDRVVRAATTATSLEGTGLGSRPRCQDTTLEDTYAQTRFETASKQSHDPPLSEVNTSGSREDSMEQQDDLTNFVAPTPHDSPLSGGYTPGSDEGRPNINELMTICTKLSNRVLALEHSKTAQYLVIKKYNTLCFQVIDDVNKSAMYLLYCTHLLEIVNV
ncbi:hypothetical protein Tco_1412882, partial [Tanacetum coccineum]